MHHGMLTVYKEAGYTSSDAVARLRGILRMRKIGHTGTLDPDAEGVLPMCLGNATRICELIADREKEYVAVMRLGVQTDTQDMSGEILRRIPDEEIPAVILDSSNGKSDQAEKSDKKDNFDQAEETDKKDSFCQTEGTDQEDNFDQADRSDQTETIGQSEVNSKTARAEMPEKGFPAETEEEIAAIIRKAAAAFTGEIEQIPPMYSAIKVNGKRLYDMARKGITVERKPRRITIHALEIEKIELPLVTMRVRCSKGTYIRTLCEDIGNALGTGAAMQSLLRTRVGQFTLEEARTLDELERLAKTEPEKLLPLIRPVDSFFADLMAAACTGEALRLLKNGNVLTPDQFRFLTDQEDPQRACRTGKPFDTDSLPGISPGEKVIRMYSAEGAFYGLYRQKAGAKNRGFYSAYKMFLPEQ